MSGDGLQAASDTCKWGTNLHSSQEEQRLPCISIRLQSYDILRIVLRKVHSSSTIHAQRGRGGLPSEIAGDSQARQDRELGSSNAILS